MRKKNILIALSALCVSLALCASPAALFAVTDAALFSGAYTQNARRGSLDITGDDVYLARVLREPRDYLYIETGYGAGVYYDSVVAVLDDIREAGIIDDTYRAVLEGFVAVADMEGTLRRTLITADITQYYGWESTLGFSVDVENTTGKAVQMSFWDDSGGIFYAFAENYGLPQNSSLLENYIAYLGFDVFSDWEYYTPIAADAMLEESQATIVAYSPTAEVYAQLVVNDITFSLAADAEYDAGRYERMIRLD